MGRKFQGASWQRCRVHFARNVLAKVPKGSADMVAAALRIVFLHPTAAETGAAWDRCAETLEPRFPKVSELMRDAKADVLAFSVFPGEHWRQIWSNNPLERMNKEIKRRCNVVQIFPDDDSAVRFVGAILFEWHDEWATRRRYFSEQSMAKLTTRDTDNVLAGELTAPG